MRIKFVVPVEMDEHGLALREAQIPQHLRDSDTEIEFCSVKQSCANFDSESDGLISEFFVYEAGLTAQEEGFDAVCIDSTSDCGMRSLRSRLDIPVLGAGIAAYHVACLLGNKFSVLTTSEVWSISPPKFLARLGLSDRLASVRYLDETPDLVNLMDDDAMEASLQALVELGLRCVYEDGADVLILGSTSMHQAAAYLNEHLPVPVISPGLVEFKLARMLVELGLSQSPRAYRRAAEPRDEIFHRAAATYPMR